MGTNNEENKWKTFIEKIGIKIMTLIGSIIIGTYILYLSRLSDSNIFSIFTDTPIDPKITKILETGECIWNNEFIKYDANNDWYIKWLSESTNNNMFQHYFKSIIKETINPIFWILKQLNFKEKGWEFVSIIILFISLTFNIILIIIISIISYLVAIVKVPIKILCFEKDWNMFDKIWLLFYIVCFLIFGIPIVGLVTMIYFFYIINKLNENFTYWSFLTNILKYKFIIPIILLLINFFVTIGTTFGWVYTLVLIPILYLFTSNYKIPNPEYPFECK
uniref:Uncharacterized protein n=1 Tax=viral metagenome TaxID=1070528 RepID=A0A6C0H671_9ZZZZ